MNRRSLASMLSSPNCPITGNKHSHPCPFEVHPPPELQLPEQRRPSLEHHATLFLGDAAAVTLNTCAARPQPFMIVVTGYTPHPASDHLTEPCALARSGGTEL